MLPPINKMTDDELLAELFQGMTPAEIEAYLIEVDRNHLLDLISQIAVTVDKGMISFPDGQSLDLKAIVAQMKNRQEARIKARHKAFCARQAVVYLEG
jgi:hypothetical protein